MHYVRVKWSIGAVNKERKPKCISPKSKVKGNKNLMIYSVEHHISMSLTVT